MYDVHVCRHHLTGCKVGFKLVCTPLAAAAQQEANMPEPQRYGPSTALLPPKEPPQMLIIDPDRLRRERKARRISLRQMATLCDCSHQAIVHYEEGTTKTIPENRAATMCWWLGLRMEEVFEPVRVSGVTDVESDVHTSSGSSTGASA